MTVYRDSVAVNAEAHPNTSNPKQTPPDAYFEPGFSFNPA